MSSINIQTISNQISSLTSTGSTGTDKYVVNITGFSTSDSIAVRFAKHVEAVSRLREFVTLLAGMPSHDSIVASGIPAELGSFLGNLKRGGHDIPRVSLVAKLLVSTWTSFSELLIKKNVPAVQKRKNHFGVAWNKSLNKLLGCLTEDSCLNNLLFINGHHGFFEASKGEPRVFKDIQSLDPIDESGSRLRLSVGRIGCDGLEDMIHRLMSNLESIHDPNDLMVTDSRSDIDWISNKVPASGLIRVPTFGINFRITWSDPATGLLSEKTSCVTSNEAKLLQIFFGGSFPGFRKIQQLLHSHTTEDAINFRFFFCFAKQMKNKICELINNSSRVPESIGNRFAVIRCPRSFPGPCACETVIIKPPSRAVAHRCMDCRLEICPWGCGRAHHGGECNIPADVASAQLISQTTKLCPGCTHPIEKNEGCNHITCRCRVQFCWICMNEYEKDRHGQYMVTEHHSDYGRDGRARCRQFDH